MDNFQITWDLFIIVFFAVIIAYSLIIGKNSTIKIILSSYVAILTADGIGNLIDKYLINQSPLIKIFLPEAGDETLIIIKIIIFVFTIVILSTKGAFEINMSNEKSSILGFFMTMIYAIFSAGLIISTILIYVSGKSLFGSFEIENLFIQNIYHNSLLVRSMINHYSVWFSLPAIAFMFSSFVGLETEQS